MRNNKDRFQKAKEYAFLLLKFRLRSEKEIAERLKEKKFEEEIIKETVGFLRDKGFIDDSVFTKAWIESRIKKPIGLRKIREELKLKGIDKEEINKSIAIIKDNYSETEVVKEVALKRLSRLKGTEANVARRRLYAYLLRRGFSTDIVLDVINQLCKQIS